MTGVWQCHLDVSCH